MRLFSQCWGRRTALTKGLLEIESGFRCDSTECQHVCRGVAAKTVGAVNTAGDFAGCVEARNYAAIDIKHLSFRIDEQSG